MQQHVSDRGQGGRALGVVAARSWIRVTSVRTSALGAGDPNAAKGIIVQYCIACHEVPGYVPTHGRAELDAPSFEAIANAAETDQAARLRALLRKPHWPMQQLQLSDRDIDNLIAFIADLRQ